MLRQRHYVSDDWGAEGAAIPLALPSVFAGFSMTSHANIVESLSKGSHFTVQNEIEIALR
jgi:hypothetical protein